MRYPRLTFFASAFVVFCGIALAATPSCESAHAGTSGNYAPMASGSASGGGNFSSDVSIPLANSAAADVQAARFVTSLASNTAGSETSNWTLSLMDNGAARGVVAFGPTTTFMSTNTNPVVRQLVINSATASGQASMSLQVNSIERGGLRGDAGGNMTFWNGAGQLAWYRNGDPGGGGGSKQALLIENTGNTVIGTPGALATTATTGFIYVPSCAGTPTGVPSEPNASGMVPVVWDTTGHKLWGYDNGAWH